MSDAPKYEVGQKLLLVYRPSYHRDTPSFRTIIVTKVGRKWVSYREETAKKSYTGDRFNSETRYVDGRGYTSHSTVWLHREEYDRHMTVVAAWDKFRRSLEHSYNVPKGVTLADIEQADKLLFKETK